MDIQPIQETKTSQNGMENLRYQWQFKQAAIKAFKTLMKQQLPYCTIRYIF
jgi:flagellar biosynthesis chaperone FliJ